MFLSFLWKINKKVYAVVIGTDSRTCFMIKRLFKGAKFRFSENTSLQSLGFKFTYLGFCLHTLGIVINTEPTRLLI